MRTATELGHSRLIDPGHNRIKVKVNPLKSVVMYIDSRKLGAARSMMIGSDQLNFVSNYTYLGHIICDDLSDESDMKAKVRQMYARSNMLR